MVAGCRPRLSRNPGDNSRVLGRGARELSECSPAKIPLADGWLHFWPAFLPADDANNLFNDLIKVTPWQQEEIRLFGRWVKQPRLTAWYGRGMTAASRYTQAAAATPWTSGLATVRDRIAVATETPFNSVLLNYYRDGSDGMGWHADDETCLGPMPLIASLSLGETRRFRLKHRHDKSQTWETELPHGSLLVMGGALQHHWQHAIPKTKKPVGARLNLTFRHLVDDDTSSG